MNGDERAGRPEHERSARVRSFIALPLPDDALDALRRARGAVKRRAERSRVTVRFLSDDALHLTLCFLGYVEREAIPEFVRVLEASAAASRISTRFAELGAFPSAKRARVVVAELDDAEGRIGALARTVSLAAEKLGVALEELAFRPHVTLARLKRPSDVSDWLAHSTLDPVSVCFGEIRLYQSTLHPTGARYSLLSRAEFAGDRA